MRNRALPGIAKLMKKSPAKQMWTGASNIIGGVDPMMGTNPNIRRKRRRKDPSLVASQNIGMARGMNVGNI